METVAHGAAVEALVKATTPAVGAARAALADALRAWRDGDPEPHRAIGLSEKERRRLTLALDDAAAAAGVSVETLLDGLAGSGLGGAARAAPSAPAASSPAVDAAERAAFVASRQGPVRASAARGAPGDPSSSDEEAEDDDARQDWGAGPKKRTLYDSDDSDASEDPGGNRTAWCLRDAS